MAATPEQLDNVDPYSISVVRSWLAMNSGGRRIITSWHQKYLARLGDGVSIALLKILDKEGVTNPQVVRDFLPIIMIAFNHPPFITLEINRDPKVTLFLLNFLRQNVRDTEAQADIERTIEFVKQSMSYDYARSRAENPSSDPTPNI
jgi:hypothetical protein